MSKLTVDWATREDLPLILHFIRALADYEQALREVEADEKALDATLFGEHPYAEVLIARWQAEPAGFALFFHNYSTWKAKPGIYLEDLFVVPEHRGQGIGHMLLARLAAIALARDCARLEWSVLSWNERAMRFYRRLGAVALDEWTGWRISDEALELLARSGA